MNADHPAPQDTATLPIALVGVDRDSYDALHTSSTFVLHSTRHFSRFSGPKAAEVLNGLVTNDVAQIAPGSGKYAAALSPKGKMLADIFILRTDPESFLVGSSASGGAAWWSMVRKYVNPRLAQYRDESAEVKSIGVYGTKAAVVLAKLGGASGAASMLGDALEEALSVWPMWRHAKWNTPNIETRLVRVPELGSVPSFELLVSTDAVDTVVPRLIKAGAVELSSSAAHVASVESGRPLWGADMDDSTIPQEANLDTLDAISFDKGCYTGQETVARIHFRGHVNRHLRGLLLAESVPVGASIFDHAEKAVGTVKRTAISPALGPIATAMVRREIEVDSTVSVRWSENRTTEARVVALPFG